MAKRKDIHKAINKVLKADNKGINKHLIIDALYSILKHTKEDE